MEYSIKIKKIEIENHHFRFTVAAEFEAVNELSKPKVIMHFDNGIEDRRLPIVIGKVAKDEDTGYVSFTSEYDYLLDRLFWRSSRSDDDIVMKFNVLYGDYYEEGIALDMTPEEFVQDETCFVCKVEGNQLRFIPQPGRAEVIARAEKKPTGAKVKGVLNSIYHWISFFVGLCLLPWFAIDALMATFGIIGYAGKAKKTNAGIIGKFIGHINGRLFYFSQHRLSVQDAVAFFKEKYRKAKCAYILYCFNKYKKNEQIAENRVSFISLRRSELSGNFQFVYDEIKDDQSLDIQMYLDPRDISELPKEQIKKFAYLCATSKVVVLDEFTPYIHYFDLRPETKVLQLWHACGAYKTFGFTRLGKPKGSPQKTRNHRSYDYVTVSTKNVKICHSEGFGIPTANVVPTGIPRTDVFFDEAYKQATRERLYAEFPQLKGKKVILYAPTFRGHVKETAHYPMKKFKVDEFMEAVGEEYFLIIKHHPFVTEKHPVPEEYAERVLDLSTQTELNDLLFITDMIITDYSSLVFEASLLNIPMLFYTFDLKSYIKDRDFYFNFESFVPGNFFYSQRALEKAIVENNLAQEKVSAFAHRFFDDFDGKATDRVVKLLYQALHE